MCPPAQEFCATGRRVHDGELGERIAVQRPWHCCTLIYTVCCVHAPCVCMRRAGMRVFGVDGAPPCAQSGTTGPPKGAMITCVLPRRGGGCGGAPAALHCTRVNL